MQKAQVSDQPVSFLDTSFRETEKACLALIETEIEVAFSFLRLAEVEINGGDEKHAVELIGKAVAVHDVVLQYVQNMRTEFGAVKRELRLEAQRLFEAVRAAERRRKESGSQIPGETVNFQLSMLSG